MFGGGKLPSRRPKLSPLASGFVPSRLYLKDELSDRSFLVDTVASVSVFPYRSSAPPVDCSLKSASGHRLHSWGQQMLPLMFDGRRYPMKFVMADCDTPILGMDFLLQYDALIDVPRRMIKLRPLPELPKPVPASCHRRMRPAPCEVRHEEPQVSFLDILKEFPEITASKVIYGTFSRPYNTKS